MSTRIRAELSLGLQGWNANLSKAEADANKFTNRMRSLGGGLLSGKSAAESAGSFRAILAAEEKLAAVRKANAFERMSEIQKITTLENEIAAAKTQIAAIDGTTVDKLKLELGIEEKLLQIERLRVTVAGALAKEQAASAAAAAAESAAQQRNLARIAQLEAIGVQRRAVREKTAQSNAARLAQLDALSAQRRAARETAALRPDGVLLGGGGPPRNAPAPAAGGRGLLGTIGGVLGRTFGIGSIVKGLLLGAGMGTALQAIHTIWEKISEKIGEAAKKAEELAGHHERIKSAGQAADSVGQSATQQMASLRGRERVLSRQLRFAQEDGNTTEAVRLGGDLAENRTAQKQLQPKVADEANERLRKANEIVEVQNQVTAERESRARSAMSLEEQLVEAKRRQVNFEQLEQRAKEGSLRRSQYALEVERAITEQVRLRAEIGNKDQEAWNRALEEEEKRQKEVNEAVDKHAEALKRVKNAKDNLATQKHDALAPSLNDLTRNPSGTRNTTAAGLGAQRILDDEQRARQLFRSGNKVTQWDPKLQRNVELGAGDFQQRALEARDAMGGQIKSGDANPFAQASAELKQAGSDLKSAAADLKNVTVVVEEAS